MDPEIKQEVIDQVKAKNPNRVAGMLKAQQIRKQKIEETKKEKERETLQKLMEKYSKKDSIQEGGTERNLPLAENQPKKEITIKPKRYVDSDSDSSSDSSEEIVYIKPKARKAVKEKTNHTKEIEELKKQLELANKKDEPAKVPEKSTKDTKQSDESEYIKQLIKYHVIGSFGR